MTLYTSSDIVMESFLPFREPPETDLEYYARPENYTGSNLKTLTRFIIAKNKETIKSETQSKECESVKEENILAERYNHVLPIQLSTYEICSINSTVSRDYENKPLFHANTEQLHQTLNNSARNQNESELNTEKEVPGHGEPTWSVLNKKGEKIIGRCNSVPAADHMKLNVDHWNLKGENFIDRCNDTFVKETLLTEVKCWKIRSKSASDILGPRNSSNRTITKGRSSKNIHRSISKDRHQQQVVDRFRKIIQAVKIVLKLAKSIMKTSDSPSALLKTFTSFSTVPDEEDEEESSSENMKKYGLHFDPSYFKANREISLSIEVRNILKLHPNRRTPEQIQTTVFGLQSIPSFAEYPLHMQEKLAKVAWLDIVTPSRTIIRQGHFAENFYFIVSGQALVTIHRPGETSAQTAALMRKGTSFGELALLHHSRRTATVTSHDTVQLLSVGRDDFFDIFMSRDIKGQVPEHITFLRQLEFMKDWPIERLLERPDQCLLHFFKRNMVIVKDSQLSEWLYVVKSGSCQVLKQLKGVTARLGPLRGQANSSPDRKSHSKIFLYGRCKTGEKRTSRIESEFRHTNVVNTDVDKVKGTFPLIEEKAAKHNATESSATPSNKTNEDPVFVRIELLKPMDIFGLDRVNFNNSVDLESTSVSLVSLGAECIMLSKSFYMKHANDKVKKRLSETITPYPNEATLQDSLQHKVNWELYKQSILLAASPKHLKRKHLTGNASRKLIIGSNH